MNTDELSISYALFHKIAFCLRGQWSNCCAKQLILDFLEEVVRRPTVLVGNSVGSLACVIAASGSDPICTFCFCQLDEDDTKG